MEIKVKVFISGSSTIKSLPRDAIEILKSCCIRNYVVMVGDCSGVDWLIQDFLNQVGYKNVIVYYSGYGNARPRNLANPSWTTRRIDPKGASGRAFYTAKDIAMSEDSDLSVAIWDGKSQGTKANIDRAGNRAVIIRL